MTQYWIDQKKRKAKQILVHYFELAAPKVAANPDCRVEIEEIVDLIVEAAVGVNRDAEAEDSEG